MLLLAITIFIIISWVTLNITLGSRKHYILVKKAIAEIG